MTGTVSKGLDKCSRHCASTVLKKTKLNWMSLKVQIVNVYNMKKYFIVTLTRNNEKKSECERKKSRLLVEAEIEFHLTITMKYKTINGDI